MTRPLRIEYPGALYHVMARGNDYQDIFLSDNDRNDFLENFWHCIDLHNLICHAYCLMGNHYHALLETPDGNLSNAMRDINGNYAQRFLANHNRIGHVLQGRYKAYVIEKETYFLEVARYIVNNPVKDGLVDDQKDWPWSSYSATAGCASVPIWLNINFTLSHFSDNLIEAQIEYQRFVKDGVALASPYSDLQGGTILGSKQFIDWIWDTVDGSEGIKEIPREQRIVGRNSLQELFSDIKTKDDRNNAIKFARFRCGYLASEIAKHLGLDASVVARISRDRYNSK